MNAIPSLRESVSAAEWAARVDLAACYRLVALHGWDDLIFTHISARVPGPEHHFLINSFGMLFEEITASSLVKVDMDGEVVGATDAPVNPAGFTIHSAVHMARSDALCVMHLHTMDGVAVSAQADGLLPLSQHAMLAMGDLAYHDYEGVALDLEERDRLIADLGRKHLMILRNHGTLTLGRTCADAFLRMFYLERACAMQVRALAGGVEPNTPELPAVEKTASLGRMGFDGYLGPLSWPALLRRLDRIDPGYKN
jgi:ribulose-5-phosphate 4-epimerase/fuculose-1-phosphate aldolase